ncbi:chorismate mutase [Sphingomicrobium astaxanthinifaciens]|uniref:chorismate mutase n=1 Tax=Sphingomicrobium astaxanthinifaciens TaxID=1227949 RepID=UPI001FCC4A68|nr:chorismate mutase [Sphingomicrobium astaxanthinifaciens]MCJ7422092.1 chorismate mutase [Sphingomicrobium astaxanthinifaciens]
MNEIRDPDACETMAHVRAGVDEVDRQLVKLLERRFGYMRAAARIKPSREAVRDQDRKDDVHAKVAAAARAAGLPAERLWPVWEELMEQSIAYEFERFDATRS